MNNLNSLLNHHHNSHLQETHDHARFDPASSHDDFLQQLLSSVPSSAASFPWADDSPPPFLGQLSEQSARMRQNQISHAAAKSLMLQQQLLLCRSLSAADDLPSPAGVDSTLLNIPQSDYNDVVDAPSFSDNAFTGLGQTPNELHHFHHSQQPENSGAAAAARSSGGGAVAGQGRPKVRARRGQATDPHSIAERLRRERIAERMKALQEIVPNANKTDKASMLDEIIDYVKFLQLQVKVLSMSRLGGAAPVAPLLGHTSSSQGKRGNGAETASTSESEERMTVAERQVAKLMEDDMGAAMQYLQGKGLCLMPISLATAISTSTPISQSRTPPG